MKGSTGILVAAAMALASTGALAKDDPVKTARKQADETYKMDKLACKPLKGDERDRCMYRASAEHDQQMILVENLKKEEKAQDAKAKRAKAKPEVSSSAGGSSLPARK